MGKRVWQQRTHSSIQASIKNKRCPAGKSEKEVIKHAPNQTQFQFPFLEIIQFITLIIPVFRFVPVFQIIPHRKLTILILQLEQQIFFQRSKPAFFLQQEQCSDFTV